MNVKQLTQLNLTDQKVSDLAWAIFGPPLLSQLSPDEPSPHLPEWHPMLDEENARFLTHLNQNPSALHQHLAKTKSHFLGSYFEALWAFYLHNHSDTQIIAKNYQVHHKGKTQGELDFVIYNKKLHQHQHLELAIKFYLEVSTEKNTIWMGPNKIDRLDKKLATLQHKQLPFSDTSLAKAALTSLGVHHTKSVAVLKGYLFRQIKNIDHFLEQLNHNPPSSNCGWLGNHQFDELRNRYEASTLWLPLQKDKWLSPAKLPDACKKNEHKLSHKQSLAACRTQAMEEKRPFLVACMGKSGTNYSEIFRVFVTPPEWPA